MPKPWVKDYVKIPMTASDENQPSGPGSDVTPGRDMGVEAPDNGVQYAGFGETRIHVNPALFEQVPRLDTSVNSETTEADNNTDDIPGLSRNPQKNNRLTPKGRLSRIISPGTVDPLTKQPEAGANSLGDREYIMQMMLMMSQTLQGIATLIKAQQPILPGYLRFDSLNGGALVANIPTRVWCQVEGKNVPFLKVLVQNNSSKILFLDFDKIATLGSIQVPANGGLYEAIVCADTISLMSSVTPNVNNNDPAGITVRGWSNPEWRNMWGQ